MSFEDLPDNWPALSLRNVALATDVVDLVVAYRDRLSNSLSLLLCDDLGRLVQPITLNKVMWGCPEPLRNRPFDMLEELLDRDELSVVAGLVVALGHRKPRIRASDYDWARTAHSRLDRLGLELFGCYLAHTRGVEQINPEPDLRHAHAS